MIEPADASPADLPEDLAPAHLERLLATRRFGGHRKVLTSCASTNDEAARGGQEGFLVVADAQSGGRGRLGRTWHSPPGENLYCSLLLRPAVPPALVPPVTLLVGAVVAEVLAVQDVSAKLKWPNDILLPTSAGLRKAGGILTEMAGDRDRVRHVVVGLGLNVHAARFPEELADRATSLFLATGRRWDRGELLAKILEAFEPAYDRFVARGPGEAIERWRRHAALGLRVRVEGLHGTILDVDDGGALLLRDEAGGVHRVVAGEVS